MVLVQEEEEEEEDPAPGGCVRAQPVDASVEVRADVRRRVSTASLRPRSRRLRVWGGHAGARRGGCQRGSERERARVEVKPEDVGVAITDDG